MKKLEAKKIFNGEVEFLFGEGDANLARRRVKPEVV